MSKSDTIFKSCSLSPALPAQLSVSSLGSLSHVSPPPPLKRDKMAARVSEVNNRLKVSSGSGQVLSGQMDSVLFQHHGMALLLQ